MKLKPKLLLCVLPLLLFTGCGNQTPTTPDSFTDGWYNRSKEMLVYKIHAVSGFHTRILDYKTMEDVSICNKPNCTHTQADCIVRRLGDEMPVLCDGKAYYFKADNPQIVDGENGKRVLDVHSVLYSYDLTSSIEEKLCQIDGGHVRSDNGVLLHDGKIWYIANECSAWGDGNGNLFGTATNGGENSLQSVSLDDRTVTDYGYMYPRAMLAEAYPNVPNSIFAMIAGIFDNKIYYNVWFLKKMPEYLGEKENTAPEIGIYVSYFDLSDGSFHGQPEHAEDIDFGKAVFCSQDYLAIAGDGKITVYKSGENEPVVFTDNSFDQNIHAVVYDDLLFCGGGKICDLNTKEMRDSAALKDKEVLAKYGDSYIISNTGNSAEHETISAAELLGCD